MKIEAIKLLWPVKIYFRPRNDSPATDWRGRRYGEKIWFSVSLGHLHIDILPERKVWRSIYLREAMNA